MDYEKSLNELEQIIKSLGSGEVPFDEATKLFEKGALLCKTLQESIEHTKGKITVIREQLGGLIEEDLD